MVLERGTVASLTVVLGRGAERVQNMEQDKALM